MTEKIQLFILFFPAFLFSLSFHECSHAYVAHRFGDDTAKQLGRITLNPLPHMDFLGTVLLPLFTFLAPAALIPIGGWGKPVPIDSRNLRGGRKGEMWVAFAGPLSNLFLAVIFAGLLRLILLSGSALSTLGPLYAILEIGVFINLGLALFNLIPLHPLDGGKVMAGILPERWVFSFNRIARYGILIIFAGYYLGLFELIRRPLRFLAGLLLPGL